MTAQDTEKKPGRIWPVVVVSLTVLLAIAVGAFILLFVVNRFELRIFMAGEPEIDISVGEDFSDPGAEARLVGSHFFKNGIPLDVQVMTNGAVDPHVPGDYEIYYGAMFRDYSASARRVVRVLDEVPPRITLASVPGAYTIPGTAYEEEGFSAWDDCDGDLTYLVNQEEKDGFVTYSVSDEAGNRTTVRRKIRYYDPIAPEISLLGADTISLTVGEVYEDPGCKATDNVDGDITQRVEILSLPDRYLAGSYEVIYSVKDAQGNETRAKRTVNVAAKGIPGVEPPDGKVIYLTFDDGPGPYTQQLLEILEKYNAKATFFVVNTDHAELIEEIVKAGHAIGIHSMSHSYKEIYASAEAYFADIFAMQQLIYEESGVMTYLMRFPGGSSNTVSRFNEGIMTYLTQAVEDNGFCYFDWNVDSNDAGGANDAEEVFENVKKGVEKRTVSIVLQHDVKGFSVEAVEEILKWGRENGYTFLALDMTSPRAHHGVNN